MQCWRPAARTKTPCMSGCVTLLTGRPAWQFQTVSPSPPTRGELVSMSLAWVRISANKITLALPAFVRQAAGKPLVTVMLLQACDL